MSKVMNRYSFIVEKILLAAKITSFLSKYKLSFD